MSRPLELLTCGFLHCIVEIGQIYLVPKIQLCYKKYVSNHTFSEIGRFCTGAHFVHKITFIVKLQLLEMTTPLNNGYCVHTNNDIGTRFFVYYSKKIEDFYDSIKIMAHRILFLARKS